MNRARGRRLLAFVIASLACGQAHAEPPRTDGAALVHMLGKRAESVYAPTSSLIGALVKLPPGRRAAELGLEDVGPGLARFRGSRAALDSLTAHHPNLAVDVNPPLHLLTDLAGERVRATVGRGAYGIEGRGALVGIADTGLDVGHRDFFDSNGKSRVAWLLDLSRAPIGLHPDLEDKFGVRDDSGKVVYGAIYSGDDIDARVATPGELPTDTVGHGTHVASLAAGGGAGGPYVGMAPGAGLLIAKLTRGASSNIENDDLLRGIAFMFDRADAMNRPAVLNVSLGADFGPHDGSLAWEQVVAGHVGADKPGHVIVSAAGNSGSIVDSRVHQTAYAAGGSEIAVPFDVRDVPQINIQVWATVRGQGDIQIGLKGPDGTILRPVARGGARGVDEGPYSAAGVYSSKVEGSPIPESSNSAILVLAGRVPQGAYDVVLEGSGLVDLYLQASVPNVGPGGASFRHGVREATVNLPADHPSIIAVGCTVSRPRWTSIAGGPVGLRIPILDAQGGLVPANPERRALEDGEMCWFSSAGPTATGIPKPEIAAPGAAIAGAMSGQAAPGQPGSIFTTNQCPPVSEGGPVDPRCFQIDASHAVTMGTSMSSPIVAGVIALLLERDPSLTQSQVRALLQAGAHRIRGLAPYEEQNGPGEVDVLGTLRALDDMKSPALALPSRQDSWIALSSSYAAADGSTPITSVIELRTDGGERRADLFEPSRLVPTVKVSGPPVEWQPAPTLERRGPGVWISRLDIPPGLGGRALTLGCNFDGAPIVEPKTIAIGTDAWSSKYSSALTGGCGLGKPLSALSSDGRWGGGLALGLGLFLRRRRARRARARLGS